MTVTLLLFAGGQTPLRIFPLDEIGRGVADGPADTDVGRPVAAHARFGQPRGADPQIHARFFSRQQGCKVRVLLVHWARFSSHF
jgi:hypothetical protein